MSRYLNEKYISLEEYVPGEQPKDMKYVKLNTNESPFPPSEGVVEAVNADAAKLLKLYPDPDCAELRGKIAKLFGYEKENIFVSNGSDDILNFSFMAFCGSGAHSVVFPDISYGFYPVFGKLYGLSVLFERPAQKFIAVNARVSRSCDKASVLCNAGIVHLSS